MNAEFINNLNEKVIQKLDCAQSEEEFRNILSENGVATEEIERFVEYLKNMPDDVSGELSEADLDDIAGGGKPWLQIWTHKWGYRIKHGKFFVKATYDENRGTITVTNRYGNPVSETNPY